MVVLGGCAITPPPAPEEIRESALQGTEIRTEWSADQPAAGPISDQWLRTFADPRLDALVDEAISRNPDLRVAATRVEQSAAYADIARGALRPSVALAGKVTGTGSAFKRFLLRIAGSDARGRLGDRPVGSIALRQERCGIQLRFGAGRLRVRAPVAGGASGPQLVHRDRGPAQPGSGNLHGAGSTGNSCSFPRTGGGWASTEGGTSRWRRANLGTLEDMVRQAQQANEQASRSLELILGRYPATELQAADAFPALPGPVPVGMPLDMLERRPDMVAAERRVAAAFDRVGEAKAARLPQLSSHRRARRHSAAMCWSSRTISRIPPLASARGCSRRSTPGGQLKAQVAVRTAEQAEALARYASQALTAIGDVENALGTSRLLAERIELLSRTLADQERAFESDLAAYRAGRQDLRPVLQQQMEVQSARMALLRVQSEQLVQRVNLHLALGGSFAEPMALAAASPEE